MYNINDKDLLKEIYEIFKNLGLNRSFVYFDGDEYAPEWTDFGMVVFYNENEIEDFEISILRKNEDLRENVLLKDMLKKRNPFLIELKEEDDCIETMLGHKYVGDVRISYVSEKKKDLREAFIIEFCKRANENKIIEKYLIDLSNMIFKVQGLNNTTENLEMDLDINNDVVKCFVKNLIKYNEDIVLEAIEGLPNSEYFNINIKIFEGIIYNEYDDDNKLLINKIADLCIEKIMDSSFKSEYIEKILNYYKKNKSDVGDNFLKENRIKKYTNENIFSEYKSVVEIVVDTKSILNNYAHINSYDLTRYLINVCTIKKEDESQYIKEILINDDDLNNSNISIKMTIFLKGGVGIEKEDIENYIHSALGSYINLNYNKSIEEQIELSGIFKKNIDVHLVKNKIDLNLKEDKINSKKRRL